MSRRVMYCHPGAELYGADRMALVTAAGLVDLGDHVTFVLPSEGPLVSRLKEKKIAVERVSIPVLRKSNLTPLGFLRLLFDSIVGMAQAIVTIRRVNPDVVYTNTITQPIWLCAAKLTRRRTVCHVRESESGANPLVQRALLLPLALADEVIVNSRSTLEFVERSSIRPNRARPRVVYNGKNWGPYFRIAPSSPTGPPRLLVVGRVSPRKGQDVVVRALGLLRDEGIYCTLRLAGDVFPGYEWYEQELLDTERSLGLEDSVTHLGFTDDVSAELEEADVVIVPSRQEPFGTVAAESLAAMRPTIVSRVEGLTEIVDHGVTGLVVEPGNEHDLAAAIKRIIADFPAAVGMAKSGRESVNQRFSLSRYHREISTIIGGRSPSNPRNVAHD